MVRPKALAAHDERARKDGYEHKCGASSFPKALRASLLEKLNCARRFEEFLTSEKLGGKADVPNVPRRACTKEWLRAQDAAHRACQKLCGRRCLKRSTALFSLRGHISHFSLGMYIPLSPEDSHRCRVRSLQGLGPPHLSRRFLCQGSLWRAGAQPPGPRRSATAPPEASARRATTGGRQTSGGNR